MINMFAPIQPLLVIFIIFSLLVYLLHFRSLILDRMIALCLTALAVISVLFPEKTTVLANIVGVGRGADLIFYVFILLGIFSFILLSSKVAKLMENQTALVRILALKSAIKPRRRE